MFMSINDRFHVLADEGDKIRTLRYSKAEYRMMSADRIAILVELKELKDVFANPSKNAKGNVR